MKMKKQFSREQIRAIAIRRAIARKAEAANQGVLPGIVTETQTKPKPMHPRLLAMCIDAAGFETDRNAA